MTVLSDKYEEMPDEVRDALSEEDFNPFEEGSQWEYAQVFVRQNADTDSRSLTRGEVQDYLDREMGLDPGKSTAHNNLIDLVEAGILTRNTKLDTHRYWLSYSLESSSATTGDEAVQDGEPAAEPVADRVSTATTASASDRFAGLTRRYFVFERVWLATLVVGLSLTLLTLVLFRLSVSTPLSLGSAALAWAALSLGIVVFIVSLRHLVDKSLGA